jgi:hypothetical protein
MAIFTAHKRVDNTKYKQLKRDIYIHVNERIFFTNYIKRSSYYDLINGSFWYKFVFEFKFFELRYFFDLFEDLIFVVEIYELLMKNIKNK